VRRKRDETRFYLVSDFHASEPSWKKMLNAIRLGIYKADAVLYAGDLTGKAIVPIVPTDTGFQATLLGVERNARDEKELADLERDITAIGYYPHVMTSDEIATIGNDEEKLHELFSYLIHKQVEHWMNLAAERLAGTDVPLYLIPGNDDPWEIDPALDASQYAVNVDGKVVDVVGGFQLLGLGKSSPTPWNTPREVSEDDFRQEIYGLSDQIRDPRKAIFLIHCPPFNTGLDTAPMLDADFNLTTSAGDLLRGPVGSKGVREAIEQVNPVLSLHGHIHESGGERMLNNSLCINPGSEAAYGVVRGYLVDISSNGIERSFRVEG
jgi:Icc-related predicted phosphoesterase